MFRKLFFPVATLFLTLAGVANAQGTPVSGAIFTETWYMSMSPIHVTQQCTVKAGNTLTISPGVDVLFDADVQFVIEGALEAVGTEMDSIRFVKGTATEWGGIRISGGDSSTIAYARISDGHAHIPGVTGYEHYGGGVYLSGSHRLRLISAVISGNRAFDGGGLLAMAGTSVTMTQSVVSDNVASDIAGGIYATGAPGDSVVLTLVNCTISGNTAPSNGGGIEAAVSTVSAKNCILWGNSPSEIYNAFGSANVTVLYSDIQGGWGAPEDMNIDADPLFAAPALGDYHLLSGSPCIDAGDPASPLDPDSTRADMGAFWFGDSTGGDELLLPQGLSVQPGPFIVGITGTITNARNVDMAFTFDPSVVQPQIPLLLRTAFDGASDAQTDWFVVGDTVFVAMASSAPVSVANGLIAELAFTSLANGASDLTWIWDSTNANEVTPDLVDGWVTVAEVLYGDVTGDGAVTAFDASKVLQHVVHKITIMPIIAGDVSDNGDLTGYDAALILYKVVVPEYKFPVEGGAAPPKASREDVLQLSWLRDANGWILSADAGDGPVGADLVLRLPESATLSSDAAFAWDRDGDLVTVAVASGGGVSELLRVEGIASVPEVVSATLNERVAEVGRPLEFALHQNAPNPFNPSTTIAFSLPDAGRATLGVYSITGQLVRTLVDGEVGAGLHRIVWDGRDAPGRDAASGVYVYRLDYTADTAGGNAVSAERTERSEVRRLTLVR